MKKWGLVHNVTSRIFLATLTAGVAICAATSQAALDFANLTGTAIEFTSGSQFSFTGGAAQWDVTTPGSAAEGLDGAFSVTGGSWTYGPITTSSTILGVQETANVTTTGGTLAINDGGGNFLTGNINWVQIYTLNGAIGGLNAGATVNVTGLTYSGSNAALLALLSGSGDGTLDLTFQFDPAVMLDALANTAVPVDTSYSGSLTAVPEPATILAGVLLLLPLGMSTLRILRKNRA
jgi:hypothetical protein